MSIHLTFALVAFVLSVLAVRDYASNGQKFSISGKIWFRMAMVFAAIASYLYFSR